MAKEKVVIEIEGDTSSLNKALEASEDAVKDLSVSGQKAVGVLDKATGGLASSFVQTAKGVQTFIKGLNLTKVAIIGTGIGALVVALGSVVTYFTQTKRGAELLQRITGSLGAVVAKLTDRVSALGEFFVNVFTNPKETITELGETIQTYVTDKVTQLLDGLGLLGSAIKKAFSGDFSGALEDARDGFGKVADSALSLNPATAGIYNLAKGAAELASEAGEAASKTYELLEAQQRLADAQRELSVETAQLRRDIKEYNLVAEDTTRPIEERINAAQRAGEIEKELLAARMEQAEEAIRIQEQLNEQSESGAEDLQALADLQIEYYSLQSESLELQTTLQNKYNGLIAEAIRLRQEESAVIEELTPRNIAAREKESERTIFAANYAQNQITALEQDELTERQKMNLHAAQGYADIMNDRAKQVGKFSETTLGIVESLNTLFAKDEEKRSRRSFTLRKALGITTAVMGTAQAVVDALAKDSVAPFSRYASAAAAAAAGAAQIAVIARQQFQPSGGASGGSSVTRPSSPPLAEANRAQQLGTPQVPTAPQEGFRSYVLANDVHTSLQANQKVREQSLLSF